MKRKLLATFATKAAIMRVGVGAALLLLAPLAVAEESAAETTTSSRSYVPARAGDFALRLEPGMALPLTDPQSGIYNLGGGQTVKALWGLNRYLDVGPSATFLALPAETLLSDHGTAWAFGGSLRLKRPHDAPDGDRLHALSPWVDVDALYVRSGPLSRPGLAAAAGLSVPLGASRVFWLGPFVRYLQILQGDRAGFDNRDAKILSLGLSLEVGSGVQREPEAVAVVAPRTIIVNKEVAICSDRDKDQVPDMADRCPDIAGPVESGGCPTYEKLVVKKEKLELKERLYFAWNQDTLQEASFPALDEVVQALKDNRGFQVMVEGHASSEGAGDRNQSLSEKRAEAVLDYLVEHGIARSRLDSKGLSSSVPADTNATLTGRVNNRRVEFVVDFTIVNDGSK